LRTVLSSPSRGYGGEGHTWATSSTFTEGQRLVADAQRQRTAVAGRCGAWAQSVEHALDDNPLALARSGKPSA
jgi:hypothetical protein